MKIQFFAKKQTKLNKFKQQNKKQFLQAASFKSLASSNTWAKYISQYRTNSSEYLNLDFFFQSYVWPDIKPRIQQENKFLFKQYYDKWQVVATYGPASITKTFMYKDLFKSANKEDCTKFYNNLIDEWTYTKYLIPEDKVSTPTQQDTKQIELLTKKIKQLDEQIQAINKSKKELQQSFQEQKQTSDGPNENYILYFQQKQKEYTVQLSQFEKQKQPITKQLTSIQNKYIVRSEQSLKIQQLENQLLILNDQLKYIQDKQNTYLQGSMNRPIRSRQIVR